VDGWHKEHGFADRQAVVLLVQLYAQLTNEFRPFVREEPATYTVSAPKRTEGFRRVVLHEYTYACAVCGTTFRLNDLVEATAAHIVPKHQQGTDDPRNGLSLCHTHHTKSG
jgi:putative restriction endonuclease